MEQHPAQPPEAHRPEIEALTVDAFLQNGTIHEALNPAITMDRYMAEGFSGQEEELQDRLTQIQREAVSEVILPETLARMSEMSLRRSGEEVYTSLLRARINLERMEEGGNAINFGLRELEDAAPRAQYALRNLQEMAYGSSGLDSEMLQRSVYDLSNFAETYEQSQRRLQSGAVEQEESVRGAVHSAVNGAEIAEDGRNHFLRGKREAEKQPESAYFDGVEEQIVRRGASTVAEHQQSATKTVETNLGHVADLRDDCVELESTLRTFGSQLGVVRALEAMPRPSMLSESVYQLKSLAYRAQEMGQLPTTQITQLTEEIGRMLQQIQQASDSLHSASRHDSAELEALQMKLSRILSSEAMQKAQ